ncbi:SH3 domain-containing protein 8 [Sarcoptes scabiei]|uniref:SH3 domain-containing protein 8 n=1 Tax=Sarcoptes scabiei TaxID=52283 RepID=A0A132A958_SARSC|nr:SH3 domain-containing protein 8 [Sarcoptes scabiei]
MFKLIAKLGCISPKPIKHPKKPLPTLPNQSDEQNDLTNESIRDQSNNQSLNRIDNLSAKHSISFDQKETSARIQSPKNTSKKSLLALQASRKSNNDSLDDGTISIVQKNRNNSVSISTKSSTNSNKNNNMVRGGHTAGNTNCSRLSNIVIALYAYESREEGELSFEKNEKLIVLDDSEPDWWLASKLNQPERKGFIPMNFVVYNAIETKE